MLSFLAGAKPPKAPKPPVEVLLALAPEVLPGPVLEVDATPNGEGAGVAFPNTELLVVLLFGNPKAEAGFAAAIEKMLLLAAASGVGMKSPLCIGFVSAFFPAEEGMGDGVPEVFPLGEPAGNPNNPPVCSVLTVPKLVGFGASHLNIAGFGVLHLGFGEGVLSC